MKFLIATSILVFGVFSFADASRLVKASVTETFVTDKSEAASIKWAALNEIGKEDIVCDKQPGEMPPNYSDLIQNSQVARLSPGPDGTAVEGVEFVDQDPQVRRTMVVLTNGNKINLVIVTAELLQKVNHGTISHPDIREEFVESKFVMCGPKAELNK